MRILRTALSVEVRDQLLTAGDGLQAFLTAVLGKEGDADKRGEHHVAIG